MPGHPSEMDTGGQRVRMLGAEHANIGWEQVGELIASRCRIAGQPGHVGQVGAGGQRIRVLCA